MVDAPADGQPQVARHERIGRREAVVVRLLPPAVAQGERVAKPFGHEQSGTCAATRKQGVPGHRRAVHDQIKLGDEPLERRVKFPGELGQAGYESPRRIVRGAARLVHEPHAVADEKEVGERSAYVDADPVAHGALSVTP